MYAFYFKNFKIYLHFIQLFEKQTYFLAVTIVMPIQRELVDLSIY